MKMEKVQEEEIESGVQEREREEKGHEVDEEILRRYMWRSFYVWRTSTCIFLEKHTCSNLLYNGNKAYIY